MRPSIGRVLFGWFIAGLVCAFVAFVFRPPVLPIVESIDEMTTDGQVSACYDAVAVYYPRVGMVAFVTIDNRRIFLEDEQWRIHR